MKDTARASLWLELKFDGLTQVFELAAGANRTIRVGSLLGADVRIARAGVKAVHVQFERLGHYVLLRPPPRSDVRVSGEPLVQPRPLAREQWLEFCGVRMSARVLEAPPHPAVVPPPSIRTPDPMITIQHPDEEEDTEITEIIPSPANQALAQSPASATVQTPSELLATQSSCASQGLTRIALVGLLVLVILLAIFGVAHK
jgi:hypothetical protein